MDDELKQVSPEWLEKAFPKENEIFIYNTLMDVDSAIMRCDELLSEVGLGINYKSQAKEIDAVMDERAILHRYITSLPEYVSEFLDKPLYEAFNKGATETISRIHMEDFSVDNTIGLTENYYIVGSGYGYGTSGTKKKDVLKFEDFLGTSDGKANGTGAYLTKTNGCVEEFADIFANQYKAMRDSGAFGGNNKLTQEEYLNQLLAMGEFNHKMDQPFKSFLSSVADMTIFIPFIEACIGEDFITGEDLTDLERGLKVVFAVIDTYTFGASALGREVLELGTEEALKYLGKTILVEFASNTAAAGIGALGEKYEWPVAATIALSLVTGITVSTVGTKIVFKNAGDEILKEVPLKGIEIGKGRLDETIEGAEDVIDGIPVLEKGSTSGTIKNDTSTVIYGTDDIENYKYNMIENPGPLAEMPNQPAKNFYGGRYNMEVLQEDKIMYRAGNEENPYGRWFTSEPPASVANVRIDTAVKPHWIDPETGAWEASSYIDNVYVINVPKGTIVYTGPVGPQGGHIWGDIMLCKHI